MASTPAGAGDLHQFTGFLLRRAYVVCREHAEVCIGEDSTVREVPALTLIRDDEAISQRRLGELLNLNRTTTGKLVDALESKGWLVRDHDARDRRTYALRLTDEGQHVLSVLHRALDRGETHLTGPLSRAEHDRLAKELQALLAGDATLPIQGLGNRCGYLIARAHGLMCRRAAHALEPLGLTPRDFGVLSALATAQPCSQQRLAAIMGVSAPGVLAFVDELESAGLVTRRRNVSDRRAYDLTLTDHGAAVLEAARGVALDLQSSIARALGAEADADLRALLTKVIGAGPMPDAVGPSRKEPQVRPVDLATRRSS